MTETAQPHLSSGAALVNGAPVSLAEATAAAAALLVKSRSPVIAGMGTDITGTRASIALARTIAASTDGFQISKRLPGLHIWRLPVMDGEFVCEGITGLTKTAVGGSNLIVIGRTADATLRAAEAAAGAIAPFPGGIVRSGSKVGSKYKGLIASTNHLH